MVRFVAAAVLVLVHACAYPPTVATGAHSAARFGGGAAGPLTGVLAIAPGAAPGLCLAVANGTNADGTPVTTAPCDGSSGQQFMVGGSGAIRVFGDKCLDVERRDVEGAPVKVWTCNSDEQQRWTLTARGTIVAMYGRCLDVDTAREVR